MDVKQKTRLFDIIIYAMAVVAVVYVIVQTVLGNNQELSFKITLGIWILAAVIIIDFVEPFLNKNFDNQRCIFIIYDSNNNGNVIYAP